ncbi:MAG: Abi-alpha family protein [Jatrophihabitantaceae bacterium]
MRDSDDSELARDVRLGPLPHPDAGLLRAVPGIARVTAASAWHMLSWSVSAGVSGTTYLMRRAVDGEPTTSILHDAVTDLRAAAWRALGLDEQHDAAGVPERIAPRSTSATDLQKRGSDLMRRANDVHVVEDTHPAFARILTEITPDEARILRFLYLEGPQPAIDVRTNRPLGIGSELVAGGLNMIAEHAGCVHLDRVEPYLTNLARLGLIEFSKEQVSNPKRYQVVEAQPKVTDALKRAGRLPRMVQRSIHLNSFGAQFCRTCLPVGDGPRASGEPGDAGRRRA